MACNLSDHVRHHHDSVSIFYSETYIPAIGGIPSYIFGWFVHTAITFALIIVYYRMCMKRKEYHVYDEKNEEVTEGGEK
mgnify:CR=1 FL=1